MRAGRLARDRVELRKDGRRYAGARRKYRINKRHYTPRKYAPQSDVAPRNRRPPPLPLSLFLVVLSQF